MTVTDKQRAKTSIWYNIKDPRLKSEAESIGAQVVGIAIST